MLDRAKRLERRLHRLLAEDGMQPAHVQRRTHALRVRLGRGTHVVGVLSLLERAAMVEVQLASVHYNITIFVT